MLGYSIWWIAISVIYPTERIWELYEIQLEMVSYLNNYVLCNQPNADLKQSKIWISFPLENLPTGFSESNVEGHLLWVK